MELPQAENWIYVLLDSEGEIKKKPVDTGLNAAKSTSEELAVYVKIQITRFMQDNEQKSMIQIIDISSTIWFDQSKEEKDLLSLINATVSHELRNPLNSIIAQNIRKESLYENMLIQIKNLDQHS